VVPAGDRNHVVAVLVQARGDHASHRTGAEDDETHQPTIRTRKRGVVSC
jgi:hypothetical protein